MAETHRPREAAHPTPFTYLKVAMLLGMLTGIEVGVLYIDALEPAFLPIFLILSVVKFCLVILFYMHLKFDSRLFSGMFVGGLLLSIAVAITLMAMFQVLSTLANPEEILEAGGEGVDLVTNGGEQPGGGESPPPVPDGEGDEVVSTPRPTEPTQPVDPATLGKELYLTVPGNAGAQVLWCYQCHFIEGEPLASGRIGPDHTQIGTLAATRRPGMSAEEYLRESIVDPEGFIPEGVVGNSPGLMTNNITADLTDEQVNALVSFMLTLK